MRAAQIQKGSAFSDRLGLRRPLVIWAFALVVGAGAVASETVGFNSSRYPVTTVTGSSGDLLEQGAGSGLFPQRATLPEVFTVGGVFAGLALLVWIGDQPRKGQPPKESSAASPE